MTGFINFDKAMGDSSAKAVAIIKKLSGMPCGHMGTLDPMATGVLPIAVGNATRLFDYFLTKRKIYVATFAFGEDYDTLDTTGKLVSDGGRVPSVGEIEAVIPSLVGEIMQVPPKYSAKNVNGRRGYELAREGKDFDLPPKKVNIYSIKILKAEDEKSFSFEIECGGGTYIRSIARDMANALGTVAAMSSLVRTVSGPFKIEDAVRLENLNKDNLYSHVIPCENLLPFESIYPKGSTAKKLFNGVAVEGDYCDGTYKIFKENGDFYGLATAEKGVLKVRTKLC